MALLIVRALVVEPFFFFSKSCGKYARPIAVSVDQWPMSDRVQNVLKGNASHFRVLLL